MDEKIGIMAELFRRYGGKNIGHFSKPTLPGVQCLFLVLLSGIDSWSYSFDHFCWLFPQLSSVLNTHLF
jgi:hypothetical protein